VPQTRRRGLRTLTVALAIALLPGARAAAAADAIDAAMADLFSGYPERHDRAAAVLAAAPETTVPRLLDALPERPQYARARVFWVLARSGALGRRALCERAPGAFDDLLWLEGAEPAKRAGVLDGLRACKEEFLEFALARLPDPRERRQRAISGLLADLHEESLAPRLAACLADEAHLWAALPCARALGGLQDARAWEALLAASRSTNNDLRTEVRRSLAARGVDAVGDAWERAPASDEAMRQELIRTLFEAGDAGIERARELGPAAVPDTVAVFLERPRLVERSKELEGLDVRVVDALRPHRRAALDHLSRRLFEGPPVERANAARLIQELGDRTSIDDLTLALEDREGIVAISAVWALVKLGDAREYPAILRMSTRQPVEGAAHSALVSLGPATLPYLEAVVGGTDGTTAGDAGLRRSAAGVVVFMGDEGLAALARTYPASATPLVDAYCRNATNEAARAVRRLAAREAFDRLVQRAGAFDGDVASLLDKIADVPPTPQDRSAFSSPEAARWKPVFLEALDDVCFEQRRFLTGASVFGATGDKAAVDGLISGLARRNCRGWRGGHTVVQEAAALALGRIGDPRSVPALIRTMEDEDFDPIPRKAAERALERIGDPAGLRALRDFRAKQASNRHRRPVSLYLPTLVAIGLGWLNLLLGTFALFLLHARERPASASRARALFLIAATGCGLLLGWRTMRWWPTLRLTGAFLAVLAVAFGLAAGWSRRHRGEALGEAVRTGAHGALFTMAGCVVGALLTVSGFLFLYFR
jgi:HEAT repeat protein